MKEILPLFLFIFFVSAGTAQTPRPDFEKQIAALPCLILANREGAPVSDSIVPDWWNAVDGETLIKALKHPAANVRAAAVIGLVWKYKGLFAREILQEAPFFLNDTASVCLKTPDNDRYRAPDRYPCGEIYFLVVAGLSGKNHIPLFVKTLPLPEEEKAGLINLVVQSNTPLSCKDNLLMYTANPPEKWYRSVREQTENGVSDLAVVCLSRYQREADIPLILAHLPKTKKEGVISLKWLPLQYFRHPRFLSYLLADLDNNITDRQYYGVVAPYKNDTARQIMEQIYRRLEGHPQRDIYIKSLQRCMEQYYSPVYAPLLTKMMEQSMNLYSIKQLPDELWRDTPDAVWTYLNAMMSVEFNRKNGLTHYYMPDMLSYLYRNAPSDSLRVFLMRYIRPGIYDSHLIQITKYALADWHPDYENMFFQLLENEPDGAHRFFYAKMLLRQQNPELEARLGAFFREHPALFPTVEDAEKAGSWVSDMNYHLSELLKSASKK